MGLFRHPQPNRRAMQKAVQSDPSHSRRSVAEFLDAIYLRRYYVVAGILLALAVAEFAVRAFPPGFEAVVTLTVDLADPASRQHRRELQSFAENFGKGFVEVRQPADSKELLLIWRNPNAKSAASEAHRVAAAYVERVREQRRAQLRTATAGERRQLDESKLRMEESAHALDGLEKQLGGEDLDRTRAEFEARLGNVTAAIETARSAEKLRSERAARLRAGDFGDAPDAVRKLVHVREESERRFAEVKGIYGDRHPEYRRYEADLRTAESALRAAVDLAIQAELAEAAAARQRAVQLGRSHERLRNQTAAANELAIEYRLQKERAAFERSRYERLEQAVREGENAPGWRSAPIRVSREASVLRTGLNRSAAYSVALAVSLASACLFAIPRVARATVLATPEEAATAAGLPNVIVLPAVERWRGLPDDAMFAGEEAPGDHAIARFRWEMNALCRDFLAVCEKGACVVVAGPGEAEGKSRVAVEMAEAFERWGRTVLLIDGNARHPVLHHLHVSAATSQGLCQALEHPDSWEGLVLRSARPDRPDVLPAGSAPACRIAETALGELTRHAGEVYDVVLIDTPGFLSSPDGLEMARCADAVVLVARVGVTSSSDLAATAGYLRRLGAEPRAVLVNDTPDAV